MKQDKWTMPEWMEKFRDSIHNTGGNTVEDLMNAGKEVNLDTNTVLSLLVIAVKSQVGMLETMRRKGLIS